ncbi:MAG: DNA helicase, partial [Kiritimatiellae bacterium]|nr:DNA helicase [Kiritimatiellia bacterium]
LRRECEKKARHKPVRQLLADIPSLAPVLKPCFLMSPLSVAQYLPPDAAPFDLVVFDEASQIPVWDAIGVIARAKQLVVVGDPKQMPPTNFFQKGESDADAEDEDVPEDMESILDECLAAGVYSAHLNWHYRSRHESLIAFSNHNYYDDRLNTFPSARTTPRLGVRFEFVEGGVYDRRATRTNEKEARALVDYIFARAKEPGYTPRSIGVVTFSQAQQELIEDLVDARREKDPSLEKLFAEDAPEPFFVKNLENVQGDERDVILFSVGYAPDADGKFAMNFGPLNRDGGERRLNVAVTRAKEQVVVFSSIHGSQIDLSRTSATGALHLRNFLDYAEKQIDNGKLKMEKGGGARSEATDESFPATVAAFLREHKWEVDEQVGASACRIDLGVRRPNGEGYLLAIECDGPAYASQRTVRDRDELRASVLKGLGWYVTRIWSVDWALDRKHAEESLLGLLDALETNEALNTGSPAAGSDASPRRPPRASALPPGVTAVRASAAHRKPPAKRAIDTIQLDELVQAMREVESDFGACEQDALYRETLKRFGLSVLTPKARSYLDAAFRRK